MCVENSLTGDRVQGAPFGLDTVALPAAHPQPASIVEVTNIAHAMPDIPISGRDFG